MRLLGLLSPLFCAACAAVALLAAGTGDPIDALAERYVKLALRIGLYDPDFVDAYYGPPQWRQARERAKRPALPARGLQREARALLAALARREPDGARVRFLRGQVAACLARLEMLGGRRMGFDEESQALYGARAAPLPESRLRELLARLERELPGSGTLAERVARHNERFVIPRERVPAVFAAAIAECRRRTLQMVELPAQENFQCEYVSGAPWGAYNWYKGGFFSLIQVNTDLPMTIDKPVGLAAHEGYPGHHLYNILLEKTLLKGRNWVEFSIYPLFSPQSLIAEGTANFGVEVIFPGDERERFEAQTLYPLAGLDPALAPERSRVVRLVRELGLAGSEAARRYLDGRLTREQAVAWIMTYELSSRERAEQNVRFFEKYRSYEINYTLGEERVRGYIDRHGGSDPQKRRELFLALLSEPTVPADLQAE